MEEQNRFFIDISTTKACTTIANLKLMVAAHILAQYDCYEVSDIGNILNETKAGTWRRPTLLKMPEMVFAAS